MRKLNQASDQELDQLISTDNKINENNNFKVTLENNKKYKIFSLTGGGTYTSILYLRYLYK